MSVDTAAKRGSALSVAFVATLLLVPVGGGQAEQQTNCHCYGGIIASFPILPPHDPPQPDPNYDIIAAIDMLMPGVVLQRSLMDAAWNAYHAKGFIVLDATDVPGILAAAKLIDAYPAALPAFPVSLPRIRDSNEDPMDNWVKYG